MIFMAFILFWNISITLLNLNSRGQSNQLYQYVNLCLYNSYIWYSNINLLSKCAPENFWQLPILKILFPFFILLYKLLREWPLNLILLPGYITSNSIQNSVNWLIYNISILFYKRITRICLSKKNTVYGEMECCANSSRVADSCS